MITNHLKSILFRMLTKLAPRKTVKSRGLSINLPCDNWVTQYRVDTFESKEPEMLDWIDSSVQDGDVMFDIGANIGLYSLYAGLRHQNIQIISFEPEYSNLHLLRDNVAQNNLGEKIKIFSIGLGKQSGPSTLHIQDLTPGAALHSESISEIDVTRFGKPVIFREGIWCLTVDDFVTSTGLAPSCIKIDVDGTEAEILQGAAKTLRSSKLRSVIMEVDEDPEIEKVCESLMLEAGFFRKFERNVVGFMRVWVWEKQAQPSQRLAGVLS